jgi:hypothetical protein
VGLNLWFVMGEQHRSDFVVELILRQIRMLWVLVADLKFQVRYLWKNFERFIRRFFLGYKVQVIVTSTLYQNNAVKMGFSFNLGSSKMQWQSKYYWSKIAELGDLIFPQHPNKCRKGFVLLKVIVRWNCILQ